MATSFSGGENHRPWASNWETLSLATVSYWERRSTFCKQRNTHSPIPLYSVLMTNCLFNICKQNSGTRTGYWMDSQLNVWMEMIVSCLKYTQHFPNKKNSFTFMFHPNDRWLILYVLQLAYSILGGFIFGARQANPVLRRTHESRFLCKQTIFWILHTWYNFSILLYMFICFHLYCRCLI